MQESKQQFPSLATSESPEQISPSPQISPDFSEQSGIDKSLSFNG